MECYDTLVEALSALRKQGYLADFNLKQNYLEYSNGEYKIFHDEFSIDKYFRFEGYSNPDDCSILYAVSSEKYGLKGIVVNAYSIYSDPVTDDMMRKLNH